MQTRDILYLPLQVGGPRHPSTPFHFAQDASGPLTEKHLLASADAPPTLLIHSRNDRLVEPREAIELAEVMAQAGAPAELYLFDGPGELHGIWREERPSPQLAEHIEDCIVEFINRLP